MVRMKDPDASNFAAVDLDFEARYRARLEEVEEKESTLPTARQGATYLAYKFSLHTLDNIPVLDEDGDVYLQWHTSGTQTGYSKPPYIGSREIAEALVGKKLDSDEVRAHMDDWDDWLVSRTAMVDLMKTTDDKTGVEKIRIVRILPDRTRGQTVQNPRPAPAQPMPPANGTTETREEKIARLKAEAEALEAVE